MKLSRIKKLCMTAKRCHLTHGPGGADWIGDGRQFYRLIGIGVDEDSLGELLGLNDKQEKKRS